MWRRNIAIVVQYLTCYDAHGGPVLLPGGHYFFCRKDKRVLVPELDEVGIFNIGNRLGPVRRTTAIWIWKLKKNQHLQVSKLFRQMLFKHIQWVFCNMPQQHIPIDYFTYTFQGPLPSERSMDIYLCVSI